jgi:hypothetical protein
VREERDAATARDDVIQAYCRHEATWATLVAAVQMLVLLPSVASSSHAPNSGASRQAWRCGPVRPRPETHTRRCGQDRGRGCVKMGLAWGGLLDQVVREVMLRCVKHGMWLTSSCEGVECRKISTGGLVLGSCRLSIDRIMTQVVSGEMHK